LKIKKKKLKSIIVILILFFSTGFFITDAYAYLDPGTGSVVLQAIIGILVGAGITVKIYWYKLKEKIFGLSKKE